MLHVTYIDIAACRATVLLLGTVMRLQFIVRTPREFYIAR